MPCCKCDNLHVEHRGLQLCATCNKIRLAGEKYATVKERKPIAQVSAHRAAMLKPRAEAYKQVSQSAKCCAACGTHRHLTPSHVLTQKQFPQHAANPLNIVVLCQDDHLLWEHSKPIFRDHYPEVWDRKMKIMEALEPLYAEQFKLKHPKLGVFKTLDEEPS